MAGFFFSLFENRFLIFKTTTTDTHKAVQRITMTTSAQTKEGDTTTSVTTKPVGKIQFMLCRILKKKIKDALHCLLKKIKKGSQIYIT